MAVGRRELLAVAALALAPPAGALTLGGLDQQPAAPPVLQAPAPEPPSFLGPGAVDEVDAHIRAWFDVVESELAAVDYSNRPACDTAPGKAYVSLVVHISESRYELQCGEFDGTRGPELKQILDVVVPGLPREVDVYVPFGLHDTVQNVRSGNLGVPVFGLIHHPLFSTVAVPFAMGNVGRQTRQPYTSIPVVGWDNFTKEWLRCNSTTAHVKKAVFRGRTYPGSKKYGTCLDSCGWEDNGRWILHEHGESHPDEFDVYVTKCSPSSKCPEMPLGQFLPLTEQLCNYQAILNVGSNSDWAERLRQCFYGNAVVMLPENSPSEFFSSFMRPWKEFWPIKPDLSDVVDQVSEVISLTNTSRQLEGQRAFAAVYLTEEFMYYYNRLAIMEYAARVKSFVSRVRDPAEEGVGEGVRNSSAAEGARSLLKLGGCRATQGRPGGCPGSLSSRHL